MTIAEKFTVFHQLNPHVYEAFKDETRASFARGFRLLGIHLILNRIRWEVELRKTYDPNYDFKICTTYIPFYERQLLVDGIVPVGFFETRKSVADNYDYHNGGPVEFNWFSMWAQKDSP